MLPKLSGPPPPPPKKTAAAGRAFEFSQLLVERVDRRRQCGVAASRGHFLSVTWARSALTCADWSAPSRTAS